MEHPWRTTNTVSEVRHGCFIKLCECMTAKWVLRHPHFHTILHLCPETNATSAIRAPYTANHRGCLQSVRNFLFPSLFPSWIGRKKWKSAVTDSDSGPESESMKIYRLRLRLRLRSKLPTPADSDSNSAALHKALQKCSAVSDRQSTHTFQPRDLHLSDYCFRLLSKRLDYYLIPTLCPVNRAYESLLTVAFDTFVIR